MPVVVAYKRQIAEALKRQQEGSVVILPDRDAVWEAEAGAVFPNMVVAKDDPQASGGSYWAPASPVRVVAVPAISCKISSRQSRTVLPLRTCHRTLT